MCGIVGYVGHRQAVDFLSRVCAGSNTAATTAPAWSRSRPTANSALVKTAGRIDLLEQKLADNSGRGHHRHRPHPLGHARRPDRRQRPSARRRRARAGARPQRRDRKLPRAEGTAGKRRLHLPLGDRHRSHRPPDRQLPRKAKRTDWPGEAIQRRGQSAMPTERSASSRWFAPCRKRWRSCTAPTAWRSCFATIPT